VFASIEGRQFVIRSNLLGIYGQALVTTRSQGKPADPTPTVVGAVKIRERFLRLSSTSELLRSDPTFWLRYRITRGSTGLEVAVGAAWSGTDTFGPNIDLWDDAYVLETRFDVEVVAERPPGTMLSRYDGTIFVRDPLDRAHPFVRWRKLHYFTGGGSVPITILSAVHKTAIRERCKFCDVREGQFGTPYVMQPLDSLPPPEQEDFSTRLCGYCFRTNG
jgi:hypothetical protein